MKRWNIIFPDHKMKLYYQDYETTKKRNPKAINITENFDVSHLEYVKKIKEFAIEMLYDYRGRKIYKIPHNSGYILVRLWMSIEDGEEYYYDGCEYQRHDEKKYIIPITWTMGNPREFYEQFLQLENHIELPTEIISPRELKKLKAIKFYNKDDKAFYKDCNGYFYYACKHNLPNKKDREEYEKFKGNNNAVRARIYKNDYSYDVKWFESEEELFKEYTELKNGTPTSYSQPHYEIKKRGYTMSHPDDRRVIFRLPYFQLEKELKYERKKCANEKSIAHWIARKWCGLMEGYRQFGEWFENERWVEDLIKRWIEYGEKEKAKGEVA